MRCAPAHPADIQLDNTDGSPTCSFRRTIRWPIDEVRHVGDIVAMVVADDRLPTAKDAAELVVVDY